MTVKTIINPGLPGFERYTFSPGVARAGKLLCVSGQTGTADDGSVVSEDFSMQTRTALDKIGAVLHNAGATFADVVKTVDYITTDDGYRATGQVRRDLWGKDYPAATGVILPRLLRPGAKIEVDCIAILPETPADTFERQTIGVDSSRYATWTFAPGILRKGNVLCISGQVGTDARGKLVAPGDIVGQATQALSNIQRIVEAVGGSMDDIVKTTDFITTMHNYKNTAAVRRAFWRHGFPAATGVVVEQLRPAGALIEVAALAVLPTIARGDRRIDLPRPGAAETACVAAATRAGKLLFISGATATDAQGNVLCPGDIAGQATVIYDKHRQVLEAAGASWEHVVQVTDYVVGLQRHYEAVNTHRRALFGSTLPAVTPLGVQALLRPEALLEVDLIAVVD